MTATHVPGRPPPHHRAGAVGAAGLGLTALGGLADPRQALASYLVAFVYWLGIALGALILLGAFHASKARWPVVLRRFLETIPLTLPLFAVLFVPIALGLRPHLHLGRPGRRHRRAAPRHRAQAPLPERAVLPGPGRRLLRGLDRGGHAAAPLERPARTPRAGTG